MGFIIIFLIAVISFLVLDKVANKTKTPLVLWLILVGILFGSYGIYDLFGKIDSINNNIGELKLVSGWAVVLLFVMSGVGLNIDAIKKSGKNTMVLSTLPVVVEGTIMAFIAFAIFMILPIQQFQFNFGFFLTVMLVFAMASPAIIIPLCFKGKSIYGKSSLWDEMMIASILDNFIPFPLVIVYVTVTLGIVAGQASSISSIILTAIISIVSMVIAYFIGHLVGWVMSYLAKVESVPAALSVLLHMIVTLIVISLAGGIGAKYGVIIGLGSGVGMNMGLKTASQKPAVLAATQKIYGLFFMPTIFIYVGTKIQLDLLLDPMIILSLAVVTILAIIIKGFVSGKYLLSQKYSDTEAKLSGTFFAAKGIILINMSLIIGGPIAAAGQENVLQYMYILAAVSILLSVPYSIIKSEKLLGKLNK